MPYGLLGLAQPTPSVYGRAGDPFWSNVSLLLRMDGQHGSTTFTDLSPTPKAMTVNGNTTVSAALPLFSNTTFFDGTGDYLSTPANTAFAFGTGDFCAECWLYVTNFGSNYIQYLTTAGSFTNFSFQIRPTAQLSFWNASSETAFGPTGAVVARRWNHIAMSRASGVMRAFLNGQQMGNAATINTNLGNTATIQFPATNTYNSQPCYMAELRVTKGAARYTSSFAPPTAPFPAF